MQEEGLDLELFLGEEEKKNRGAKRGGHSPWKRANTVALDGPVADVVADVVAVDRAADVVDGTEVDRLLEEGS